MTDFTYDIAALEDAKFALRKVKSDIRAEEEHKALVAARVRIAERHREADYAFARELAAAAAKGIPQTILRKKVIKTNDWDTWKYWRDLAEIEPERVSISNAKAATKEKAEQSKKKYEWIDGALHWYKWSNGEQMPFPMIVSDYATLSGNINWGPTLFDVIDNDNALWKEIKATIQKDARSGIIPDRDLFRWQPGNEHLGEKQEELNAAWIGWAPDEN